jgi:HK97 gp10 family phage protein
MATAIKRADNVGKLQFSLEGDQQLIKFFQDLGKAAAGKVLRKVARDATKVAFDAIQKATPKETGKTANKSLYLRADKKKKRGEIKFVIGYKAQVFKRKRKGINKAVFNFAKRFKTRHTKGIRGLFNKAIVLAKQIVGVKNDRRFHPWMIEFGTKHRAARPFFRATFAAVSPAVIQLWRKELRLILAKANQAKYGNGPLLLPD